jgi:hypothetical protein
LVYIVWKYELDMIAREGSAGRLRFGRQLGMKNRNQRKLNPGIGL